MISAVRYRRQAAATSYGSDRYWDLAYCSTRSAFAGPV